MGSTGKRDEEATSFSTEELAKMLQDGGVRVIDVRSPEEFAAAHIEGSVNVPLDQLSRESPELVGADRVVTVCARGGARSHAGAERVRSFGFQALPLCGGVAEWERVHGSARTDGDQ